jgi:hypothetical protein
MGNATDLLHEFNCALNNISCSMGGLRATFDAFGLVANKIENRISELRDKEDRIIRHQAELIRREEQITLKELELAQREKALAELWMADKSKDTSKLVDKITLNVGMLI